MSVVVEAKRGGMRIVGSGGGGKGGGGSPRTPVESPDSLHNHSFAALLDVIGNGEMAGPVHPDSPLRDVYLDGTPLENDDGTLNFELVQMGYRVGTVDQEHIAGFPVSANVVAVGRELKTTQSYSQRIGNTAISAVRISLHVGQLMKIVEEGDTAGDRVGYRVEYAIDLAMGSGAFKEVLKSAFDGKTVNGYTRTHRIELPASETGWTVRVRRLTPESSSFSIFDTVSVQSYAEVMDGKFRYPMTALVGIKVSAEQFQSIPARAYHWRGQIIRVPSNYDPQTRKYTGVWDGSFKRAYSNNPAWVYFDMLTSQLYGLGDRIDASMIDRYALYQIGAYCDQLVPDGMGGQEPRFVCNVYLQSQEDALRVLNDLTSTFRGMAYWANGQVVAVADSPSDPVYTYANADVVDGRFEYTGADSSTLKTVALVSWNDPTDFYRSKVEVVEDAEGIRIFGVRKTELVGFGCTSRGQAQRVGLYHLYTSRMETGGVGFSVGLDGVIPQPGSLVRIADRNRAGREIGGRIHAATLVSVTLDRHAPVKSGDRLTVNLPTGKSETRVVRSVLERVVTVSPAFSRVPASEAIWAVDADDLVTQLVRVVSIKETGGIAYEISGVLHHPDKFNAIDHGARLEDFPVSVVPPRVQTAPRNVRLAQFTTVKQGTTRTTAEITWDRVQHAIWYEVQWRRDNSDWISVPRTGSRLIQLSDIYTGHYQARVRAVNALEVSSLWAYSELTELDGMFGEPPVITSIVTESIPWGINVRWTFPRGPNIIERTEIRYSLTERFESSFLLGEYSYPTNTLTQQGLRPAQDIYYWARLVDKNGVAGQWYPSDSEPGVMGSTSAHADDYNELITQEILGSALGEQLWADIESIPDILVDFDSLEDAFNKLGQDFSLLETQISELMGTPDWSNEATYALGQVVKFEKGLFRALQDVPVGVEITDTTYWEKIGNYDSLGEAVSALLSRMDDVEVLVDEVTSEVTAHAQTLTGLQTDVESLDQTVQGSAQAIEHLETKTTLLEDKVETSARLRSSLSAV